MSRIGKKPIQIPSGVTVTVQDREVCVKGPKGELHQIIRPEIEAKVENGVLLVFPKIETKRTSAFWGLTRALLQGAVEGVSNGFEKKLELEGVGYRVNLEGNTLVLLLGFSHPVKFPAPEGITFKVEKNVITISGFNKVLVSETAAKIRALKKPEPYKGKGIRYQGEVIRRKAGKKAASTA